MRLESRSARRISAILGASVAAYFATHLWFFFSTSSQLDEVNRRQLFDQARLSLAYWALFVIAGIALCALAWRFDSLNLLAKRAFLVGCLALGVLAVVRAEWWASVCFLYCAGTLALAHRRTAHA